MRSDKRVTLKMIAEHAGTSIGTVDRALNNREGISADSRAMILKVAQELGYRPNKFASALSRKKTLRIGLVFPVEPKAFYHDIERGIDQAGEELADYGVVLEKLRYPRQDPACALELLGSIDPMGYDGLVINSAGPSQTKKINEFVQMGIPVFTFNNDAPDSNRLLYVGNDNRQSGMMGGELLGMLMNGRGNVTVLGNFAQTTPFMERFAGFCEYMQDHLPNIHIYPAPESRSDTEQATQSLLKMLQMMPEIGGVFTTGYTCTIGAVEALRRLGRRDIYLVGYDVSPQTVEAMQGGWCAALLYQNPFMQGYQAAQLMAKHLLDGWQPQQQRRHIETQVILKSNLENYAQHKNSTDNPL